jgi:hypothetical protein
LTIKNLKTKNSQRREKNKTPEEEQPVEQALDTNANLEYIQVEYFFFMFWT